MEEKSRAGRSTPDWGGLGRGRGWRLCCRLLIERYRLVAFLVRKSCRLGRGDCLDEVNVGEGSEVGGERTTEGTRQGKVTVRAKSRALRHYIAEDYIVGSWKPPASPARVNPQVGVTMETTRVLGVFSEAQTLLYQCNIDILWGWVDGTGKEAT